MRLSLPLFFKKLPGGNIFRGKYKIEPKIRSFMKRDLIRDIKREEANMLILRHHYLTKAQVKGYRYDMGKESEFVLEKQAFQYDKTWPAHIRLEDRYGELRETDMWEKFEKSLS